MKTRLCLVRLCLVLLVGSPSISVAQPNADIDMMKQQLAEIQRQRQVEAANLENFDDLDFNVYSG